MGVLSNILTLLGGLSKMDFSNLIYWSRSCIILLNRAKARLGSV